MTNQTQVRPSINQKVINPASPPTCLGSENDMYAPAKTFGTESDQIPIRRIALGVWKYVRFTAVAGDAVASAASAATSIRAPH